MNLQTAMKAKQRFTAIRALALCVLTLLSGWAYPKVTTPHTEGERIQGTVSFETRSLLATSRLVDVPLPMGSWRVLDSRSIKSTGQQTDGLQLALDLVEQQRVVGFLNLRVFGAGTFTWNPPSECSTSRAILKGPLQPSETAECYSIWYGTFFTAMSDYQNKIRAYWTRDKAEKFGNAVVLSGFAPNRSGAVVYFELRIPVPSSIIRVDAVWFQRYAELLFNEVMGRPIGDREASTIRAQSLVALQAQMGMLGESASALATPASPVPDSVSRTHDDKPAAIDQSPVAIERERLRTEVETAREQQRKAEEAVARLKEQLDNKPVQDARLSDLVAENQRLHAEAAVVRERQRQADETVARLQEQLRQQQLAAQQQAPSPTQNKRVALVIGNDTYKLIPRLQTAGEDARAVAESLQQLGYRVTLRQNLSERDMKSTLRNFSAQVRGGDEVVMFFAGHGVQIGSSNFLLPVDIAGESETQIRDEAIPLQRMLDDMTERRAGFTLAIVDACRDNPFKGTGRSIGAAKGLAATTVSTGQMLVFSAGAGQQALDRLGPLDKDRNGVFTRVFLREMRNRELSIDRIIRRVRSEVVELARSVGQEQVPAIYEQVVGDYFFFR